MPREVELKLEIDRDSVEAITEIAGRMGAVGGTKTLRTVYFDTDDHRLYKAGLSLRVRHDGVNRIQTVKAEQSKSAGLYDRDEWECAIESDLPVLASDSPVTEVLGGNGSDRITSIFQMSIDRTTARVAANEYDIELVVDRGEVAADDQLAPVSEVELELKRGTPANLFALARGLDAAAAVRLGVLTKAERGYRLLGRLGSGAARAEPIRLESTMTAAKAFQTIAWSCIRHFRLNETASSQDPDALHQARVGLRRLRSALSLFKPIVEDDRFELLRGELRWLSAVLGEARNIDVVIERTSDAAILQRLRDARTTVSEAVEMALASTRSRSLMLDLAEWLATGDWLSGPANDKRRDCSIHRFATDCLGRFRRRLKRRGRGLSGLDDKGRHQVRIEAKKLRYATEFFTSLFTAKKESRRHTGFREALANLQEQLGSLNDLATAPLVWAQVGVHPEAATPGARDALLIEAKVAYKAFTGTKRFW